MTLDVIVWFKSPFEWQGYDVDRDFCMRYVGEGFPLELCRRRVELPASNPMMSTSLARYVKDILVFDIESYNDQTFYVYCADIVHKLELKRLASKKWDIRCKRMLVEDTEARRRSFTLTAENVHNAVLLAIFAIRSDVMIEKIRARAAGQGSSNW